MINVVIVDDHPIVRAGMRAILDRADDIQVVGEGGSRSEALNLAAKLSPHVMVLDIGLPDGNGMEVAAALKANGSSTSVLILTAQNDPQIIFTLLENGATGYVLKDEALETLANAVRAAAEGKSWLSPSVANQVIQRAIHKESAGNVSTFEETGEPLTNREKEVLGLLAEGLDNEAIADRLILSKRTIQNHISTIYAKMGVKSRTEAMLYAIQHGITGKT